MKFHDLGRGYLIEARHRYAMELAATVTALLLTIQACHGPEELQRSVSEVEDALS